VNGVGLVDLARTHALWDKYLVPDAIIRRRLWTDPASISLPFMYANTGQILAVGLHARGDTADAQRVFAKAQAIGEALGLMRSRKEGQKGQTRLTSQEVNRV
jgi:hypothetical protein